MKREKDKKNMTFKEKAIDNIKVFLSAYAIAFFIRLFFIEAYQIPSQSMVPSLFVKDIMMIEKVSLGPLLPLIDIKIPGFFKPERNDIFAFVSPQWRSQGKLFELISLLSLSLIAPDNSFENPRNLVKRLIGLPGDRISMNNRVLILNAKVLPQDYILTISEIQYDYGKRLNLYRDYDFYKESADGKTRVVQHISGAALFDRYPLIYQFHMIYVPKKNDIINLNQDPYYQGLLLLLIRRESRDTNIIIENGKFYKDGVELKEWKVMHNYYFAMGDNRDESYDSRYFGFVPEENIIGRPIFRYFPFTRLGFDLNETENTARRRTILD